MADEPSAEFVQVPRDALEDAIRVLGYAAEGGASAALEGLEDALKAHTASTSSTSSNGSSNETKEKR